MIDNKILEIFKKEITTIKTKQQLIEYKNVFLKKHVATLYKNIHVVEDKKAYGQALNNLKKAIEEIFLMQLQTINNAQNELIASEFNPLLQINYLDVGGCNLIDFIMNDIKTFFSNLNFKIVQGEEVCQAIFNFDYLNVANDHSSRDLHDTFYINDDVVLRTHCTSSSAYEMFNNKADEIKVLSYGNVYRKDEDDATHSHQFNQIDFIWIRKDLNFCNLKWIVDCFLKYIFNEKDIKTRYRLSYFPFTEPSFEVDISCFKCQANGCNICKQSGWIEIMGAGIFHPNVIKNTNLDSSMIGLAAGIGIDRLAMLKYNIKDIRDLYNNNFNLLTNFKELK